MRKSIKMNFFVICPKIFLTINSSSLFMVVPLITIVLYVKPLSLLVIMIILLIATSYNDWDLLYTETNNKVQRCVCTTFWLPELTAQTVVGETCIQISKLQYRLTNAARSQNGLSYAAVETISVFWWFKQQRRFGSVSSVEEHLRPWVWYSATNEKKKERKE